jgi:hypothetical protein
VVQVIRTRHQGVPDIIHIRPRELRKVTFASSVGTVFEWYDFFLYATLAPFFAFLFFPPGNETAALLAAFATYAAGFIVRPFGAVLFGRFGDTVGRKYVFLITILLMGGATFAIGLLPTYEQVGWLAPALLVTLRITQGLALGGEYGGAATYVAEHTVSEHRGYVTSLIQTTASGGFLLSLIVILACRLVIDEQDFAEWGWRIPFLLSLVLLILSIYIRLRLSESPLFQYMKSRGQDSKHPLRDAFLRYPNNKNALLALLGAAAGQGVIWYTGQFYALFFLQITMKVDYLIAYGIMISALLISIPLFLFFGWLSDRIGRKQVILAGCLLAAMTYFPLFQMLAQAVNPDLVAFQERTEVTLRANPDNCQLHVFVGPWSNFTDCDQARDFLTDRGVSFTIIDVPANAPQTITVGDSNPIPIENWQRETNGEAVLSALRGVGFPEQADPRDINVPLAVFIIVVMIGYVAMVYAPIAALLVEMFPTQIRYTSVSVPYHIGNGWFGGMLPLIGTAAVAATGNIYYGLWYPIIIAVMSIVIGGLFLRDTRGRELTETS